MSFAAENLSCLRGGRLVFEKVAFAVEAGEALIVEGANGSGKSSLLKICAGLLAPAAGRLLRDGHDIAEDPDAHRRSLAYVGHLDAVKPVLTVRQNLTGWAELYGAADQARIDAALDRLELLPLARLPARLLSAGQKRRLGLARLLVQDADLWILDEPTVSLDRASAATVGHLVGQHLAQGGMAVAATHIDLGFAARRLLLAGADAWDEATA